MDQLSSMWSRLGPRVGHLSIGNHIPPRKLTKTFGKSPYLMGKLTISTAVASIANCKHLPEGSRQMPIEPRMLDHVTVSSRHLDRDQGYRYIE